NLGKSLSVIDCRFKGLNAVINGNGRPRGVLFMGNEARFEDRVGTMAWGEGTDWVFLDNRVQAASMWIMRLSPVYRVLVAYNDFENRYNGLLRFETGHQFSVHSNKLKGNTSGTGPLGYPDGKKGIYWLRFASWIVIEANEFSSIHALSVSPGSEHIAIRNNFF